MVVQQRENRVIDEVRDGQEIMPAAAGTCVNLTLDRVRCWGLGISQGIELVLILLLVVHEDIDMRVRGLVRVQIPSSALGHVFRTKRPSAPAWWLKNNINNH